MKNSYSILEFFSKKALFVVQCSKNGKTVQYNKCECFLPNWVNSYLFTSKAKNQHFWGEILQLQQYISEFFFVLVSKMLHLNNLEFDEAIILRYWIISQNCTFFGFHSTVFFSSFKENKNHWVHLLVFKIEVDWWSRGQTQRPDNGELLYSGITGNPTGWTSGASPTSGCSGGSSHWAEKIENIAINIIGIRVSPYIHEVLNSFNIYWIFKFSKLWKIIRVMW